MKQIIYILLIAFPLNMYSQGESDWWYFGNYIGLHFDADTVEEVFNSELYSFGLPSTVLSTSDGELLFYGTSGYLFNSNHEFMEGIPIPFGATSQALPFPSSDSIYAYISTTSSGGFWGFEEFLTYSVIDMSLDGGLGEVISQTILPDTILPFLATIKKPNNQDYWVIVRKPYGNEFIAYSLDSDGLHLDDPTYSYSGDNFQIVDQDQYIAGTMKINPQGTILSLVHPYNGTGNGSSEALVEGKLELLHFNNEEGVVEERIIKLDSTNASLAAYNFLFNAHDVEFSPDGEKIYYSSSGQIVQCNISVLDSVSIIGSLTELNIDDGVQFPQGLQLAKNGKIYINTATNDLWVINNPNQFGLDADLQINSILLSGNSGRYFPRFEPSLFSSGFTVSNRCLFDETQFTLIYDLPYEYVFWEFGDGAISTEWEPTHVYSETGIYTVQLTTVIDDDTTQKEMEVIIEGYPSVELGPDSSLFCEGDTLVLDAYNYASYYTWQDSSYQSTFEVIDEGNYYVEVKNICGQASDTVEFVLDRDNVHLGTDTLICVEEPLLLLANQPTATSWLWQDGSTLPFYEAQQTGEYYVEVTTPCLFIYDSIYVDTKICSLLPPNIITPNGDGINDYFVVENLYEFGYMWSIEIFNRWGQQVYFSENYQNNWRGDHVNDGVYFYVLKSQDTDRSYNGSVTVLRK